VAQSEVDCSEKQELLERLSSSLNEEMDEYKQKVSELNAMIDDMKARIREGLDNVGEKASSVTDEEK
jgi:uncharacterized coiled-coil DUF342 family protein